jgi:hypothetical protein
MRCFKWTSAALVGSLTSAALAGVFTVDGTIAGDGYSGARSVQAVETQFGDNFSELDAGYGEIAGGQLYLALTGNLEGNFNKLEVFIDAKAGGEAVFSGLPGNDGAGVMTGLTFDTGFQPDYHVIARRGNDGTDKFDLDFAELGTGNFSSYINVFGGSQEGAATTGAPTSTGVGPGNDQPIGVAYDNSNVAGVAGGDGAANMADALAVQTGLEFSFDLTDLDYAGGAIRVMAFVNGSNHNFASNQFLGPLTPPQGNLGGDGAGGFTGFLNFDLRQFPGDQFFVIPEPASLGLFGVGALALLRRKS